MPTEDDKFDFFSKQAWEEDRHETTAGLRSPKKSGGDEEIKPAEGEAEGAKKEEGELNYGLQKRNHLITHVQGEWRIYI